MKWKRIDGDDAYDPDYWEEEGIPHPVTGRLYGLNGNPWPRIWIQVDRVPLHGPELAGTAEIAITASRKEEPGQYWSRCGIPECLKSDLFEMLDGKIECITGECECGAPLYQHSYLSPQTFKCYNRACKKFDIEVER